MPLEPSARSSLPRRRSACPISNALDLLGDRWTLLVVRDLLFAGKRRFGEFLASPERIPTNILADRLRRLEGSGLIHRTPYGERPRRFEYGLTAKGAGLFPVLRELIRWASRNLPGTSQPPPALLARARRQRATAAAAEL